MCPCLKTRSRPTHSTLCTQCSHRAATSSQVFNLIRFHFTSPPTWRGGKRHKGKPNQTATIPPPHLHQLCQKKYLLQRPDKKWKTFHYQCLPAGVRLAYLGTIMKRLLLGASRITVTIITLSSMALQITCKIFKKNSYAFFWTVTLTIAPPCRPNRLYCILFLQNAPHVISIGGYLPIAPLHHFNRALYPPAVSRPGSATESPRHPACPLCPVRLLLL